MRTALRACVLLLLVWTYGSAATRSDINTIEAAEKIRYLSQKIAKDYLYLYSRPKRTDLKEEIQVMIDDLGQNLETIAASTKDSSTKDLLKYLDYSKQNIEELLSKNVTKNGSLQMLDYSEILLEGAESIAREHRYSFNPEEAMLMNIKRYEYLVERLGKFYMASSLGALSQTNRKKMETSRQALEEGLQTIKSYQYPAYLREQKKELERFWHSSTFILSHAYDMFIPNLVNIASTYFEHLLTQFALYHSKSQ
jgi:uncharacterized protein YsxB (DUF464 family)